MKHIILVKFKKEIENKEDIIHNIKQLFSESTSLQGIYSVHIHKNIIDLSNRYDFMIELEMEMESLFLFDQSMIHKIWKHTYSSYIESKAIFDYQ